MKFKTENERREWAQVSTENPRMFKVGTMLDLYTQTEFGKEITLTEVYRTQAEHDALYAQTPPDKRPVTSPHMRWEAFDVRSHDFTQAQIDKMLKFLNLVTVYGGQRQCAIYHTITGNAFHFHVQVSK